MKKVFVDSGVFYAWIDRRDENHPRAADFFRRSITEGVRFVTTMYVIAEAHALIVGRMHRPDIGLEFLESMFEGGAHLEPSTEKDEKAAVSLLRQHRDKEYSFCDAVSFRVMERLRIREAAAFDRHFKQYGRVKVVI